MTSRENSRRFYDGPGASSAQNDDDGTLQAAAVAEVEALVPGSPAQVAFPESMLSRTVDRQVLAARAARTAVGIVLVCGAAVLIATALGGAISGSQKTHGAQAIVGTWLVALAAYPLVNAFARARFAASDPGRAEYRGMFASYAWPLAGLALMLPLSLHLVVYAADSTSSFDKWVLMSMVLVGHCHITLALMSVRRMRRLVDGEPAMQPAAIYGIVVGISMIPGALLLLIPPILVALTGLPFLFLLWVPERMMAKERQQLLA